MSSESAPRRGLVLGKFMPPHLGHVYLVDFARAYVDQLTVVVERVRDEPIASALRFDWMKELCPGCEVVHLREEQPQDPSEHRDFWAIWQAALERVMPYRPDFVFASERYGAKLASVLGAKFVPVDPVRAIMPISGTAVRRDPFGHWRYLPENVRAHYVKRVCVFGPESTGKSTLVLKLADHFQTQAVPEYARTLIELQGGEFEQSDLLNIARGQLASEAALARKANKLLFCDTDVLTTTIWSEALYGSCDPELKDLVGQSRYDLTLLLDVDVPWVADPVRYLPDQRRSFFERCQQALEQHGRRYHLIRGNWDQRFAQAVAAVSGLLSESHRG